MRSTNAAFQYDLENSIVKITEIATKNLPHGESADDVHLPIAKGQ